jgi:hypothetical protein
MKSDPWPPFPQQPDRGQRRYHVNDERLRAFAKLTPGERMKWVEECAAFVRLGQQALAHAQGQAGQKES